MPTTLESMCCRAYKPDTKRDIVISEMLQQENIRCICQHSGFSEILSTYNLDNWIEYYKQYNPEYFAAMDQNEQFRHVAYRRWVHWQFGTLAVGERVVLPACVVTCIRETFPSWDGKYKGFHYRFKKTQSSSQMPSPRKTGNNAQRVKIAQLLQSNDCTNDSGFVIAKVVALQASVQKDELVHKHRLRLVLADETDAILAFLTKPKPDWLKEGTDVLIVNYSCSKHTITINDQTNIAMTGPMRISAAIFDVARNIFITPQAPVATIQAASALPGQSQVTITGHVIQTEDTRIVYLKSGDPIYVRNLHLSDHKVTIRVTLWDASAAYAEIKVGDHLKVMDATLAYNAYYRAKTLSVSFLDQIVHMPPESSTIEESSPAKRKRYEY